MVQVKSGRPGMSWIWLARKKLGRVRFSKMFLFQGRVLRLLQAKISFYLRSGREISLTERKGWSSLSPTLLESRAGTGLGPSP